MTTQTLRDELDLGMAVRDVATPDQDGVVVIITTRFGVHTTDFDVPALADAAGPGVRFVVVPPHLTNALNDRLGDELAVYGGAARVFPVRKPGRRYVAPVITASAGKTAAGKAVAGKAHPAVRDKVDRLLADIRRAVADSTPPVAASTAAATTHEPTQGLATVTGGVSRVDSPEMAVALATHLLSPGRTRPALLVTRRAGDAAPPVDVERIVADVGTLVDVFEMGTGEVSWAFSNALAPFPGTECYGGAGRVYPLGSDWATQLHLSPLRFTWTDAQSAQSTEELIRDALAAARLSTYSAKLAATRPVAGTVLGTVSGRGIVTLDQGGTATIVPELTVAGITAGQLVRQGMRVAGQLDAASGRLDVRSSLTPAAQALQHHREGDLVTARVVAVERGLAILEVFPEVQSAVLAEQVVSGRFIVDVRQWVTEGEVVAARVLAVGGDEDEWELSLLDIDPDAAPLPAPPLLPGGPPWLLEPQAWDDLDPDEGEAEAEPAASVLAPTPAPVVAPAPVVMVGEPVTAPAADAAVVAELEADLRVMTAERDALAREIDRLQDAARQDANELSKLRRRAREREQSLDKANRQLAAKDKQLAGVDDILDERDRDRRAFADSADQFRYEVELEWARRIPAAEKAELARSAYRLGPHFLGSLADLTDRDRAKTLEVVIEVMTGRVYAMPGRQTHQLRTGAGGDDPYVTRPDGATCWRVYLQHHTPQARRLHFWALSDGSVELSSVRPHDDMRP